jgi:hypothetical protein
VIGLTQDYYELVDSGSRPADASGTGDAEPAEAGIPSGKLVFHRYTTYETGDSQMFVVTFPDGTISDELGQTYGLCNPMNGIFSPNGNSLAVMAALRSGDSGDCGPTDRSKFDVYILDLTTPGQKQQVTQNTFPDEDPQFSPAGDFILFKHNGHLAKWMVDSPPFTTCSPLSQGSFCFNAPSGEQSKPVMTTDDRVCYYESSGANADIFCFDLGSGLGGVDITVNQNHTTAVAHPGINDSRPTIAMPYLYYVRWRDQANTKNFIERKDLGNLAGLGDPTGFVRDTGADYTDPCSLPNDVLIFSSDVTGIGGHDLFLAGFQSTDIQALDQVVPLVNTKLEELGASFWIQR